MLILLEIFIRSIVPPFYSLSLVEKICKRKLNKNSDDRQTIWILSNFYVWYKKYEKAKILLELLLKLSKARKVDKLLLSKVYYNLKEYSKVVEILYDCEPLDDKDMSKFYLGNSLMEIGNYKKSIGLINNYIKFHKPTNYLVYARLGNAYYMEDLFQLALSSYEKAEKLNPSDKKIKEGINLCLSMLGKTTVTKITEEKT